MILFDTLEYAKKLKEAGFTEAQAEAQAEGIVQILESNVATKHDIADVKHDIADVKRDIEQLRAELKRDIAELGMKLTIRLGGMLVVAVGMLAAMKFFG